MQLCDVCDAADFELLAGICSPRLPEFRGEVAICRKCGFVTQYPRPATDLYAAVNDRWFGLAFSDDPDAGATESQRANKARQFWSRIESYVRADIGHALDIGAGQGSILRLLRERFPTIETAAIEKVPDARASLQREGVRLVGASVEGDWHMRWQGQFDLVILRHTLEHLEHPREALAKIANVLAPGGDAYIVVPNAMAVRAGHPIRTDFFRPVHLHYFNRETLALLARRAGLIADKLDADGEIWGVFRHAHADEPLCMPAGASTSTYKAQESLLRERLRQSRWVDRRAILKVALRRRIPPAALDLLRRTRSTVNVLSAR
jgi:SAM-dependent methyltransferase